MAFKKHQEFLGVRFEARNLESVIESAMASVHLRRPTFNFACANPHSLVTAKADPQFQRALRACSVVVADGVGVTLVSRAVGVDVGPRITGNDFFLSMMMQINRRGGRVFFLGSRDEVLERIVARARRDYPNVHVDVLSPPYGEWSEQTNSELKRRIVEARPDVLWVGMTAPRQEKWVHRNLHALDVPVVGSIGAVFDFYAGTVRRAPQWLCDLGFEWLYRLAHEPSRLWRRTLISAPAFLWLVLREHLLSTNRRS
jgi:N-acetylglucosaminyldiphosphoundecaprenol N-acetyl-beta-D-mannosaminyltransferase